MKSKFETWFVRQHGERISVSWDKCNDDELRDYIDNGQAAARELARRKSWDERHESALYGWQAAAMKEGKDG